MNRHSADIRMDKGVVLLSGGMDSATLLHYVKRALGVPEVHALSFVYGQKHSRELAMASRQAASAGAVEHRIVDVSFLGGLLGASSALLDGGADVPDLASLTPDERRQPPTYVPNRNMVFLSIAAAYAESRGVRDVYYGAQAQDEYGYWDCTEEFVDGISALLGLNRRAGVRVRAPFVNETKAGILRMGLRLGVDYAHTWSCYRGAEKPCGTCPTCVERAAAFRAAGRDDPLLSTQGGRPPSGVSARAGEERGEGGPGDG
ncbi:7-cyano-7-deazaguanine synthase QueC [Verrucomicrobiota bacterium]